MIFVSKNILCGTDNWQKAVKSGCVGSMRAVQVKNKIREKIYIKN